MSKLPSKKTLKKLNLLKALKKSILESEFESAKSIEVKNQQRVIEIEDEEKDVFQGSQNIVIDECNSMT